MAFLAGCSGSLNDVGKPMSGGSSNEGGDPNESGTAGTGAGGSGEVAGTGGGYEFGGTGPYPTAGTAGSYPAGGTGGGYEFGGAAGIGGYPIGGSFGGDTFGGTGGYFPTAGTASAGTGGGFNNPPECFDSFETYWDDDHLDLAPQNSVLLDIHQAQMPPVNSANQLLFPNSFTGQWEMYANFAPVSADLASKADISLPAELASLPDNLAQFYVTRRNCADEVVGGHKLTVEVWWKGVAGAPPTHGLALGTYDKKKKVTTWLPDATKAFVIGGMASKRLTDTLNRVQISHTFAADDKTDARQIVMGLWLAPADEVPTTFYVGNVIWN
ncbi:MAG TPA: hypothetical protein VHB79_10140 [Polyangiaceae bacterium]|nr:hypothetical protein [Polyangiaceae bacterium]